MADELRRWADEGRWDLVMAGCLPTDALSESLVMDVFEHIFRHLVHFHDLANAKRVLDESNALSVVLRTRHPARHAELGTLLLLNGGAAFATEEALLAQRSQLAVRLADAVAPPPPPPPPPVALLLPSNSSFFKSKVQATCAVSGGGGGPACLCVGTTDGFVERFDWDSMQRIKPIKEDELDGVIFVDSAVSALASSGNLLAVGVQGGLVHVFNCEGNPHQQKQFQSGFDLVTHVCFCGDQSRLAVLGTSSSGGGSGGVCRVFSASTGMRMCEVHSSAAFSAVTHVDDNNNVLLTGTVDGRISAWNVTSGGTKLWDINTTTSGMKRILRFHGHLFATEHGVYQLVASDAAAASEPYVAKLVAAAPVEDFSTVSSREAVIMTRQGEVRRVSLDAAPPVVPAASTTTTAARFITLVARGDAAVAVWANHVARV